MKKYRRNFDEAINEKMMRLGSEVADTVAYAVATKAQDKLIQYGATRAKNSKSMALIQELADSIEIVDEKSRVVSTGSGYYAYKKKISGPLVKIPTGKNRIALFLEFGTGLVGANSRSDDIKEESKRFGWRYAINDGTEKTINTLIGKFKTKWYPTITLESGRKITGFIFRRKGEEYKDPIAIGDIGTQLFYFNPSNTASSTFTNGCFEYAVPITAGGEFGGDVESFDAPETDLDYIPKISGRTSLNDIAYTLNYTKERYARAREISSSTTPQTYMEVLSDGSAVIFNATCGRPTITSGDVRQIGFTLVPQLMIWVSDIYNLTADELEQLDEDWYTTSSGTSKINIDVDSIPSYRPEYYTAKNN
ncbi:unnamed protein product [Cylicocyclus nassatus]|uniref:Uncharacterized protein n=1 Tax=Cylicocyclus nassatus TaxID=53992 RepID=A0AA36GKG6_CYLNA|nr:unnamed protein product [Cylicocyclus nassatus]